MAVDRDRAFNRTLQLYYQANGITPSSSDKNILKWCIQAILEELTQHLEINAGIHVSGSTDPTTGIFSGATDAQGSAK